MRPEDGRRSPAGGAGMRSIEEMAAAGLFSVAGVKAIVARPACHRNPPPREVRLRRIILGTKLLLEPRVTPISASDVSAYYRVFELGTHSRL